MNDTTDPVAAPAGAEPISIAEAEDATTPLPVKSNEEEYVVKNERAANSDRDNRATKHSEASDTAEAKAEVEKTEIAKNEAAWREAKKIQLVNRPASATRPSRATFCALPTDLKILIVERLLRPSDIQNLCLTSKELHEIAVRSLYRVVNLDLGSPADTKLSAFLNPRNIGLKWIRQIRLYLAHVDDVCNQDVQATFATRMIIEMLPEHILEEFSWCPWKQFSADNLTLLYKKQKKMTWLEVMQLDRPFTAELKKNVALHGVFENARRLAVYPENPEVLEQSRFFIEKTGDKIEELIIHPHFDLSGSHNPSSSSISLRELNDSATGHGLLTRTLFAHLLPFDQCKPFANLTNLRLHCINLRYCADSWCKVIDFQRVELLRLYQCTGVDTLFAQMSQAQYMPRKLRFFEFQHQDNDENEALLAMDAFLCLVSGITDLTIDMQCVKALPAAAGIARHGKTLEVLSIHCSNDPAGSLRSRTTPSEHAELIYDTESFGKISKAATKLEQLSCAWPERSITRIPGAEWEAFKTSVLALRDMVTLRISNWPTNKPHSLQRQHYEHMLQGIATQIFSCMKWEDEPTPLAAQTAEGEAAAAADVTVTAVSPAPTKLRLVAFGISDQIYERHDSSQQRIYLRSTALDAEGKPQPHAAPIDWCLRQFVEPRSEVLDTALCRIASMPCRGEGEGRHGSWGEDDE